MYRTYADSAQEYIQELRARLLPERPYIRVPKINSNQSKSDILSIVTMETLVVQRKSLEIDTLKEEAKGEQSSIYTYTNESITVVKKSPEKSDTSGGVIPGCEVWDG